jgi:CheY-like chemotaxis protein
VGPMDHSYRNNLNGGSNSGGSGRFRPGPMVSGATGFFQHPEIEPLPAREDANTRIFAFVDDLFFRTKIQETARKLNVKLEFVKSEKEILDRPEAEEQPALIIFDLNNASAKPLSTIPKLRSKLKKGTSILGFVSHVQGDLKVKALEAGCDAVMPRSAFSQNLVQLLRRHGAAEQAEEAQGL